MKKKDAGEVLAEVEEMLGGRFHVMALISYWPGIHGTNKGQNVRVSGTSRRPKSFEVIFTMPV